VTQPDLLAELPRLVTDLPQDQLLRAVGIIAQAQAIVLKRVMAPPILPKAVEVRSDRLLTPPQAAAIASVPVKRIYEWARGQEWACRPSRRCLRVAERPFRAWLAARS
jgi:hypothetical protein